MTRAAVVMLSSASSQYPAAGPCQPSPARRDCKLPYGSRTCRTELSFGQQGVVERVNSNLRLKTHDDARTLPRISALLLRVRAVKPVAAYRLQLYLDYRTGLHIGALSTSLGELDGETPSTSSRTSRPSQAAKMTYTASSTRW